MKKFLSFLMAILIIFVGNLAYATDIPVYIDGERLEFDVHPQIINDRTMVPMRFIFEKFGAKVIYEEETRAIMASYIDSSGKEAIIFMIIDNQKAFINNTMVTLDTPPFETDGRTLVPLRFISEALGYDVSWNEYETAVYISTQ